jgi:hypothetical protein
MRPPCPQLDPRDAPNVEPRAASRNVIRLSHPISTLGAIIAGIWTKHSYPRRRIQRASKWHRNRNIQRVSTITTQLLTIMQPRITIIRRSTITRSASMKRPRSTPRQLRGTASLPTSIRQTLTRTLINDVTAGAAASRLYVHRLRRRTTAFRATSACATSGEVQSLLVADLQRPSAKVERPEIRTHCAHGANSFAGASLARHVHPIRWGPPARRVAKIEHMCAFAISAGPTFGGKECDQISLSQCRGSIF